MTVSEVKMCAEATVVNGKYAVRSKELPRDYKNKDGKFFFIEVGDKTGNITVKYWGGPDGGKTVEFFNSLSVGDIVELSGIVEKDRYDSRNAIAINEGANKIEKVGTTKAMLADGTMSDSSIDYLPSSESIEESFIKLKRHAASIDDAHLRALVLLFLEKPEFAEAFKTVPGTSMNHHNYIGGNIEHTLAVTELCIKMCEMHKLDRDLLVAAAILHDVGKVKEYTADVSIEITDDGKFLGHVHMGIIMVSEMIRNIPHFPDETASKLLHTIVNHHGAPDTGLAKGVKLAEACALNLANALDMRTKEFLQIKQEMDGSTDRWVYARSLGTDIFIK